MNRWECGQDTARFEAAELQRLGAGPMTPVCVYLLGRDGLEGLAHQNHKVGRAGILDPKPCPHGYSSRFVW